MMARNSFLVIGSNCFTGSHIVDALLEDPDKEVIGISRSPDYKNFFLPCKRHPGGELFVSSTRYGQAVR